MLNSYGMNELCKNERLDEETYNNLIIRSIKFTDFNT